jgi:hypothetical protein
VKCPSPNPKAGIRPKKINRFFKGMASPKVVQLSRAVNFAHSTTGKKDPASSIFPIIITALSNICT